MFHLQIRENPVTFVEKTLASPLWNKQQDIIRAVFANDLVTVGSGHGSGKTYVSARITLAFMFAFPPAIVVTTAPTFRQVENLLWREIRTAHKLAAVPLGGDMLKTRYEIEEDWYAIGIASKTPESVAGFHAKYILFICDEASGIPDEIFEAIQGVLTSESAKLLLIGNRTKRIGYFADSFADPDFVKFQISCFDTPNFTANGILTPDDLTQEAVDRARIVMPQLVTPGWALKLKNKYGPNSDVFRVRAMGLPPKKDADTLVSIDKIEAAIDAERERYGVDQILGVDPARFGDDDTSMVERVGNWARLYEKRHGQDTMETAGKVVNYLRSNPAAVAKIDSIGIGAGIVDRCKEHKDVADRVFAVNSASQAVDPEHYINQRAESWDTVNEWLDDAVLESCEDDDWYEIAKPRYKILSSGKMQLESKEDMKKRGISSPNTADALAQTFMTPSEEEELEPNIRTI